MASVYNQPAPGQVAAGDPYFAEYLRQCLAGPPCAIELYADAVVHEHVARYTIRRVKPGLYRAMILFADRADVPVRLMGHEDTRVNCGCWLRAYGVPVLRVGAVQGQ